MTDNRIIDSKRYNAERKFQADLLKRDLERDKILAQLYQESYDRMQAQIDQFFVSYAGKNGLTKQEAMKRVSDFDVTKFNQKASEAVKNKDFSNTTNEWLRTYNLKSKVSRLELLKSELALEIQNLTAEANEIFDKARYDELNNEYKRQSGILGNSATRAPRRLETILDADFYGQKFSDRVWGSAGLRSTLQRDVFGSLNRIYTDMMGYKQEMQRLAKKYSTSRSNAQRLLKTEIARINADTQLTVLKENKFTHIIFVAERGACDLCGPLDQKAIPIEDVEKGVNFYPMHPNCRCSAYGHIKMDYKSGGSTIDEYADLESDNRHARYPYMDNVIDDWVDGRNHAPDINISNQVTKDGKTYIVDGHNVVLDHSNYEYQVADWLSRTTGRHVDVLPRVNNPENVRTPDYLVDGVPFDLKEITGHGKYVIDGNLRKTKKQAPNIIFDITKSPLSQKEIIEQIEQVYRVGRRGLETVILKDGDKIVYVFTSTN